MSEYFMPISELSKKLDIPSHTLRFWEKEFPTIIVPTTGAGNRRFYRPETVANITAIKKYLYADGYTIDGVKKLIANNEFMVSPVEVLEASETIESAIELLLSAKKELEN